MPNHMPTIATQRILRAIVDERRRALSRELHGHGQHHRRPPIEDRLAELKHQAETYREKAIVLNAKLSALSGEPFQAMREQLVQSSARIDHGVAGIVDAAANSGDDDHASDN
jgi:hypothetical protein